MARQLVQRLARIFGIAISLAVAAPDALAEAVYKWTDAEGVTHFSALPPEGQPAEQLELDAGAEEIVQQPPAPAGGESQDTAHGEGTTTAGTEQLLDPETQARIEQERAKNCEKARANLEVLETRIHVRVEDEETGQVRYLTPPELEQTKTDTIEQIKAYCESSGT